MKEIYIFNNGNNSWKISKSLITNIEEKQILNVENDIDRFN